jgi:hypothetical protein
MLRTIGLMGRFKGAKPPKAKNWGILKPLEIALSNNSEIIYFTILYFSPLKSFAL